MTSTTAKQAFWTGARDSVPFLVVALPFGLLFGVVAGEAGLDVLETLSFSVAVFAGAAQFTALKLMEQAAPVLIVLVSALAVNLRVAMYSAALTPWLGPAPLWQRVVAAFFIVDQSYALSVGKFESNPTLPVSDRMAYFAGTNALIAPGWCTATLAGALAGTRIPEAWSLDFALPIAFLALVGPMLRTPAHMVAALTAILTAIAAAAVPHNLGLILAGMAGMVAGATTETLIDARKARPR
ncbi:MAG: AzlC family ABC transporter permease [Marinibacterium sp.]